MKRFDEAIKHVLKEATMSNYKPATSSVSEDSVAGTIEYVDELKGLVGEVAAAYPSCSLLKTFAKYVSRIDTDDTDVVIGGMDFLGMDEVYKYWFKNIKIQQANLKKQGPCTLGDVITEELERDGEEGPWFVNPVIDNFRRKFADFASVKNAKLSLSQIITHQLKRIMDTEFDS